MNDYGTRQTDLAVRRAEWRLSRVYRQAQRDIDEKLKAWREGHERREERYRQMVKDGKMSQADFDAWMRGQVFQDKQWQARKEEIDRVLLNADREAQRIINEGKLGCFADGANRTMYEVEQVTGVNTNFAMYDEATVARLIKSDPQILPKAAPGVVKDKSYAYYNKLMNSAITQGIIQGESIQQIARRIMDKTGESTYKAAVRNARTAYTGAQNAGTLDSMRRARNMGIKIKKKWLAILDNRTRDSHAELDGQERELDEPFISPLGKIMYPGDPTAEPGDVYNCRCDMVNVYPDYPSEMQRRDAETGEIVGDITYEEWAAMKRGEGQEEAPYVAPQKDDTNIYGRHIEIDDRLTGGVRETLETLIDEYDTRLEKVELGHAAGVLAAGSVDMSGAGMKISAREPTVAIHEFAHTLANSKADKYGLTHDGDFWKEIKKIRRDYKKDVDKEYNFKRFISGYEHSATGAEAIDEFFAEAFAQAKAREMGIPLPDKYGEDFTYSQRVLEITDKYFRRGHHGKR